MEKIINQKIIKDTNKELLYVINNINIYSLEKNNGISFIIEGKINKPYEIYYDMITDKNYMIKRISKFSENILNKNPIIIQRKYVLETEYFHIKQYNFTEKWKIIEKNQDEVELYSQIMNSEYIDNYDNIKEGYKKIIIKNDKEDTYLSAIINYQINCNEFLKSLIISKCIELLRKLFKF